jgi:tetratricopeptide (TPR) repeat protein
LEELLPAAEADAEVAPVATLVRLEWLAQARPEEFLRDVGRSLPAAIAELKRRRDARGLAKAYWVAHIPHNLAARHTAMAEELRMAAEYAREAQDPGMRAQALGWYVVALWFGRTPAAEIEQALDAIEREQPGPYLGAWVDNIRGDLHSLAGRFEESRLLQQRACDQLQALGQRVLRAAMMLGWGMTELWAENPAGARDVLLEADSALAQAAESSFRSTVQAELARAYERLGEHDAALAAIELSLELGAEGDVVNFVTTDSVRARLALADGDLAEAENRARSALHRAAQTEMLIEQGLAELELARVLAAAGKRDEAAAHAQEALAAFEIKGDQVHSPQARALLDGL